MKKIFSLLLIFSACPLPGNNLPYDFQAYDFCVKYAFTSQGLLITVHRGDELLVHNQPIHGEILLPAGATFRRFVPGRPWIDTYHLDRMTENRAYFTKERNNFVFDPRSPAREKVLLGRSLTRSTFFLPKDHYFGWIGWLFPTIEIHPGDQAWRSR